MSHLMRSWYLPHRRPAKAPAHLRICAVSPEPSLLAHMKYGSRWRVRPKFRHLATVDGCTCGFEEWVYGGRKVPSSHESAQMVSIFKEGLLNFFVSSPEPWGSQGELIVYPYSVVRCRCRCCCLRHRQQCLNIFSSETALPIKAKFYVEPPWEGGMKVYINGPSHMTKMAAMPKYGKNL